MHPSVPFPPTRYRTAAAWLYLVNTVLLTVHEIDSAYWHEWRLLRLPGRVVEWRPGARAISCALAVLGGILAVSIVQLAVTLRTRAETG